MLEGLGRRLAVEEVCEEEAGGQVAHADGRSREGEQRRRHVPRGAAETSSISKERSGSRPACARCLTSTRRGPLSRSCRAARRTCAGSRGSVRVMTPSSSTLGQTTLAAEAEAEAWCSCTPGQGWG